jgi:hypothetical protein
VEPIGGYMNKAKILELAVMLVCADVTDPGQRPVHYPARIRRYIKELEEIATEKGIAIYE